MPASLITDVDEERKLSDAARVLVDKYMKQCAAAKVRAERIICRVWCKPVLTDVI